jgi:hypothetical protein
MTNPSPTVDRKNITQLVKTNLDRAAASSGRLRRTNTSLILANIVSSALTTLVTGATAAAGPLVGSGIEGWRLACSVGAGLALVSTITAGVVQQTRISDRLSENSQCLGRLRAIETALALNTRPLDQLAIELQEILKTYPNVFN